MLPHVDRPKDGETHLGLSNAFQMTNNVAADTSFLRRSFAPALSGRMKTHRHAPEREPLERRAQLRRRENFLLRHGSLLGLLEQLSSRSREVRRIRISFS
jgi:hypothetical protein